MEQGGETKVFDPFVSFVVECINQEAFISNKRCVCVYMCVHVCVCVHVCTCDF